MKLFGNLFSNDPRNFTVRATEAAQLIKSIDTAAITTSFSFFFLRTPLNASITLKWNSWRTSDRAQDFDAIILLDPCSRADTSTQVNSADYVFVNEWCRLRFHQTSVSQWVHVSGHVAKAWNTDAISYWSRALGLIQPCKKRSATRGHRSF